MSFGLPAATCSTACSCTSAPGRALTPPSCTRPRSRRSAAGSPTSSAGRASTSSTTRRRNRRRASGRRRRLRPACPPAGGVRRRHRPPRSHRDPLGLARRPAPTTASSTATARPWSTTSTRRWRRVTPLTIINERAPRGMKVVGELFGTGEMQLPFVLQSAETMKALGRHPRGPHGEGRTAVGQGASCSPP